MISSPDSPPPQDLASAHALIARLSAQLAEKEEALAAHESEIARLNSIVAQMRRRQFGRSSEKLDPEQLLLGLDDVETAIAEAESEQEGRGATPSASRRRPAPVKRKPLPAHLPRIEEVVDIEDKTCPCCGGALHVIGEDRSERLDVTPAQHRVIVTRRPKYGCRGCEGAVVQAPAPPHLVEGGLPTEAMIAHLLVNKYANHLPIYRQWQMLERQGIEIDRASMIEWGGRGLNVLKPIAARMLEKLKQSTKLFCDETTAPVLDPGRGRVKKGYLWAVARDDRAWNGPDPPGVVYCYAPGRGGKHIVERLDGFSGVLQVDGYSAYNALVDGERFKGEVALAFCWAHLRRDFYEIAESGNAPIAQEALARIAALYAIEEKIRRRSADDRRGVRQRESKPLVCALKEWLEKKLEIVPKKSRTAEAIRYGLKRWEGFSRFLEDGRIEIDSNCVERTIRPLALNRKNALFAGSDEGGALWGVAASLIETCKLNAVEPHTYLVDVLTKLASRWPMSRIDELLPWAYVKPQIDVA